MKKIDFKKLLWLDFVDPSKKEISDLSQKYHFHELDIEALYEENQRVRVDSYDDYIFMVFQFPKFDIKTKRYIINELDIFLSKKYLITVRYHNSSSIDGVFSKYSSLVLPEDEMKSGYALYDLLDSMLDKVFRLLDKFSKDLRTLENQIFKNAGKDLINEIMIKKRNAITLKHMLTPQIQVLKMLELRTNALFKDEFELYFENLIDKLEKITSEINIIQENIESMEDTLKSIFDLQTNSSVKYLTIFSAFMLPLTLVTGFFGMNLNNVPFNDYLVYFIFLFVTILMIGILIFLIKSKKL